MYSEVLLEQYCLALDGLRGANISQWKYGNRHRGRSDSRTQILVPLSVASPGETGRVHAPGKARRILYTLTASDRALCGMPEFLTSVLLTLLVTVSNSWGCGTAEGPVTNIG